MSTSMGEQPIKRVLVLGAGLVSRPLIRYLLSLDDYRLTVADVVAEKAAAHLDNHPHGSAVALDIQDTATVGEHIANHDVTISLLPNVLHVPVAKICLEKKRSLVTTSYVSDEMRALDQQAHDAGIVLLNEVGLDPGIDHMSAMKVIREAQQNGGEVSGFFSVCGGLPAPEANDNPFGYKFSWSPKAVLMAGASDARYLADGEIRMVAGAELFDHCQPVRIPDLAEFEGYPNRDSLPYREIYGIPTTKTMFRGTLRHQGWCETLSAMADLGVGDDSPRTDLSGLTFRQFAGKLIHDPEARDIKAATAAFLGLTEESRALANLEWLGLFSDDPLPPGDSVMDVFSARMLAKMAYGPDERDMVVLHHTFTIQYPNRTETRTSTLVDYGIPGGDSAMARTVSLPAALCARLILEGNVPQTGVQIPTLSEIYQPVLTQLEHFDIRLDECTAAE